MNYYAEGGQAHGLKALAQELPKYGRGGDSMVAHINPEEAAMLKAMGGSGTINPTTGLPEYWGGLGKLNPVKAISKVGDSIGVSQALTKALQPVEKAVVQPASNALASFDKAVGNTIPGGWGTVGTIAASMIPGGQFAALGLSKAAALGGLGALTGSGVLRPGRGFNLQGAVLGGAMAYGAANLASGLEGAAEGAASAVEKVTEEGIKSGTQTALSGTTSGYVPSDFLSGTSIGAGASNAASGTSSALTPTANALSRAGDFVAPAVTSGGASSGINALSSAAQPASFGLSSAIPQAGTSALGFGNVAVQPGLLESAGNYISNLPANIAGKATNAYDALTTPSNYTDFAKSYGENVSKIGSGIKDLVTGAPGASAGFSSAGAELTNTALPIVMGAQGLAALDEQRKYLQDQANSGAISNEEYNTALARIEAQADEARKVVAANPLRVNSGIEGISEGPSLYEKEGSNETLYDKNPYGGTTLYATGGVVNPFDDQTGMPSQTPMQRLETGGITGYASGGMPRFLSGGGDGMSDSIPANIGGTQEARLADGEFVIPADVVSHLGNGSSKAGAKQLYSMMDKVRQARVGTKKQGKQINPRKYLAA